MVVWDVPCHFFIIMKDLYTRFNNELREKVEDVRKLFSFLSSSYAGSDADIIRIRQTYRELTDMKIFYVSKNNSTMKNTERAWRSDYQTQEALAAHINKEIDPFIDMLQFVIELYDEDITA